MLTIAFLAPQFLQRLEYRMRRPSNHHTPRRQSLVSAYLQRRGKARPAYRADDRREQLQQIFNKRTVEGCRERSM
jgi:hypothetical protein